MIVVLLLVLGTAIISQLYLDYTYLVADVGTGRALPSPSFVEDLVTSLRSLGANILICHIGVYCIKANFLIFFYRLGSNLTKYRICWWIVAVVTMASFVVTMAMMEYKCTMGSLEVMLVECNQPSYLVRQWWNLIVPCILDAATELLSK